MSVIANKHGIGSNRKISHSSRTKPSFFKSYSNVFPNSEKHSRKFSFAPEK